jgi:iron complex transport system substrate-binding protein
MKHLFLFALLLILTACNSASKTAKIGSVEVKYARHFSIEQKADYAVLQILQPETGEVERTYALAKKENMGKVPADMDKIEIPVKNMAVLSTTHIGMLNALKALDCIKGSTDVNFVANPTVKRRVRSGKIVSFNDETALTPERLLQKEISLVVYSGFGKVFPNEDKLKKLDILVMADYDWREENKLGKA